MRYRYLMRILPVYRTFIDDVSLWKFQFTAHLQYDPADPACRRSIPNKNNNNDSGVVKLVGITYLLNQKLQIQVFSLRNKFSDQQTYIFRSRIIIMCRRRRLEVFTTMTPKLFEWLVDSSQFFPRRRRVSFSTAIATQLVWKISWGDTPGSPTLWAPRKRDSFPVDKILHTPLHWLSSLSLKYFSHITQLILPASSSPPTVWHQSPISR